MKTSYYVAGGLLAAAGLLLAFNAFNLRTIAREFLEDQGILDTEDELQERSGSSPSGRTASSRAPRPEPMGSRAGR